MSAPCSVILELDFFSCESKVFLRSLNYPGYYKCRGGLEALLRNSAVMMGR